MFVSVSDAAALTANTAAIAKLQNPLKIQQIMVA